MQVIHASREDLEDQLQRLLTEVGMTASELKERADAYTLSARERDIWETVEGIRYLLGCDG